MLIGYYIVCLIYCFYQLNVKYKERGIDYSSPEMDAIMVLMMAWVLAPVDCVTACVTPPGNSDNSDWTEDAVVVAGDNALIATPCILVAFTLLAKSACDKTITNKATCLLIITIENNPFQVIE